jgi:mannose-6-phosphate isomerase-like protein (cupin superfamily)
MRRNLGRIGVGGLAVAIVAAFASPTARSQAAPRGSVFLSAADITRVITAPNGGGIDRQLRVVPSDTHNVGVGILRRGALKDSGAAAALNHERVSEVYYVISGSGTLLTGGTVKDVKPVDAKSETVTRRPEQQRDVRAGGGAPDAESGRRGDHSAGRVSRVQRHSRSHRVPLDARGCRPGAARRLRASRPEVAAVRSAAEPKLAARAFNRRRRRATRCPDADRTLHSPTRYTDGRRRRRARGRSSSRPSP